MPELHSVGARASTKSASKKTLAVSKTAKQNARFATAVPPGVDIMADDLRGYVLECDAIHCGS